MLNATQQQAIEITEGPLRIIAGAGTGKTFTLINKINYLITEKGFFPHKILILTFTNKACNELKERLVKMGQENTQALTFHSLSAKLLRKFWKQDFKILSAGETETVLKQLLPDLEKNKVKDMLTDIQTLQSHKILPERILRFLSDKQKEELQELGEKYEQLLEAKNALNFNALLTKLLELWNENAGMLQQCQQLFDYVLVDEYQDVNAIQIEILKKLVEPHNNICVVGDEDQTIYSWRGAKASNMQEFENIFPKAKSITLTKNYRNPVAILQGAEQLIQHNENRLKKTLESTLNKESQINFWHSKNEYQQYEILLYLLEQYLGSTSDMYKADALDTAKEEGFCRLSDIALLYRTQMQGRLLSEYLAKKGYPYQISCGEYFWEQKEIKTFLEELAPLSQHFIFRQEGKFSAWLTERIENFIQSKKLSAPQQNRLQHLITYSFAFNNLPLQEALQTFLDETKTEQEADNLLYADRINLLTLHAAKGLEFPIVLIFGLEEDELPYKKSKDDSYYLEEERRLLYVGMTRAQEALHLFSLQKKRDKEQTPSRFLAEIGKENMVLENLPEERSKKIKKKEAKKAQMKLL